MKTNALWVVALAILGLGLSTPSFGEEATKEAIKDQPKSKIYDDAAAVEPLKPGQKIPDLTLRNVKGEELTLKEAIGDTPTVLVFYRGSWCPFCNAHLAELAKAQDEIVAKGYQILAVSPDKPENLKAATQKNDLKYTLLSDSDMSPAKTFGVAFKLDDSVVDKYKNDYGIDLVAASGGQNRGWALPVPAVYLINPDGEITWMHFDPDYKKRLENGKLMNAIDKVAHSQS